jgi:hypothetical protein
MKPGDYDVEAMLANLMATAMGLTGAAQELEERIALLARYVKMMESERSKERPAPQQITLTAGPTIGTTVPVTFVWPTTGGGNVHGVTSATGAITYYVDGQQVWPSTPPETGDTKEQM